MRTVSGWPASSDSPQEGARVVIADVLDDPGESAAVDLRGEGHEAIFVHLDAASPADNEAAVLVAARDFGSLDILVTAAGISFAGYTSGDDSRPTRDHRGSAAMSPATAFLHTPLEAWQPVLDVNLTGTMLAVQAAGKQMVGQPGGGSIITIASIAALAGEAGSLAYSVSKAGVWMVTKMAATALASEGVRVNAIGPGYIDTNMTKIIATRPGLLPAAARPDPDAPVRGAARDRQCGALPGQRRGVVRDR